MTREITLDRAVLPSEAGRGARSLRRVDERLNRAVGFTSVLLCVVSGMILGLWSFGGPLPVPDGIGDYGDLPRRLIRLGHIAFFGLGMINLALAGHARSLPFDPASRSRALTLMNLGNGGLPPLLIAAAWLPGLIYALAVPVACVFLSLCLAARAAWRGCSTRQRIDDGG